MRSKRVVFGALMTGSVALTGIAVAATANAATVTEAASVFASDDAYVSSIRRTTNFGSADKLVVGRDGTDTKTSLVKFSVPAGAITGAELRLPTEGKQVASTVTLYRLLSNSWSESTVTAAKAPALGTAVASTKVGATDAIVRFDLSKVVTKGGVYSFALKSSATRDVTRLRAVEYGDPKSGGPELRMKVTRTVADAPTTAPVTTAPVTTPPTTAPVTTPPTTAPVTTPPTTAPVTTAPAVDPTTPDPAPTTEPGTEECVTDELLVPSCGVLWGGAAGGFTDTPRDVAIKQWEQLTGRTSTIWHQYHKGDELFPTKAEIAMAQDPAHPRVLLLNWKVAYNTTWAKVASGAHNARIDRWAAHVKANYNDRFFLALHHEPENDVNPTAGSGMTAKDYAAMYRHVILRLRAQGVDNAVNVIAYMGNEKWMAQSWWKDLYPGDDVVDWMGLDSYSSVEKGYYHYGDFRSLLDRQPSGGGTGWYDWAVQNHPTKPIMVAEWGMYHRTSVTVSKAAAYNSVLPELKNRPQIKAIVHFDTEKDDEGDRNIHVATTPDGLTAFRKLAADPIFDVKLG